MDSIKQIVKDVCGIQAQYFHNAVHALKLRYQEEVNQQSLLELVKTWTVRGTLHLICVDDWSLFVSALHNEWFDRWGKYLENYFSLEERNQWQTEIYKLIQAGIVQREKMVSHFSDTAITKDLIQVALSSWGGILKDLAYQGKIIYAGVDKTDFRICDFSHPIQEESAKIKLIERYLIGYGPATINDIAHWTQFRVTEIKKLFKRISIPLNTIVDQHKTEYYYLPNSREMNTRSIPKYLFLAGFDPLLLGYKDKGRFMKPEYHDMVFKKNGFVHSVLLYEGQIIGIWKKHGYVLEIQLFEEIPSLEKPLLLNEVHHHCIGEVKDVNISRY